MKIKINKKSHEIKPASELTVKEYIDYFFGIDEDTGSRECLVRYISVVTGMKYKSVASVDIDHRSTLRLFAYIGEVHQAFSFPEKKEFYYKRTGKTIYQKSVNWRTIGIRGMMESSRIENQLEQITYLLAVLLCDYDNDKANEINKELQDYRAVDVFGFTAFFFKNLYLGRKKDRNFLRRLLKKANTNMMKLSSK